jgi:hypothetical protein
MQERLAQHLSHFASRRGRTVLQELTRCRQEYQPLENFSGKLKKFQGYSRLDGLFDAAKLSFYRSIYEHLLLHLDHTYKDVVKMRYDMLWNLLTVVTSVKCRRIEILPHFGDALEESYRCGACDVCAPNLDFPDIRNAPKARASNAEKELLLKTTIDSELFDLKTLRELTDEFADYPTAKYRQARSVLEGNANNLVALFVARVFSPPDELEGNAKRLLRTANQRPVPLGDVQSVFQTSPPKLKSDLLSTLNEADTACDSPSGWKFLAAESARPEYRHNPQLAAMGECLEFFLVVTETPTETIETLKRKAEELEEVFYA